MSKQTFSLTYSTCLLPQRAARPIRRGVIKAKDFGKRISMFVMVKNASLKQSTSFSPVNRDWHRALSKGTLKGVDDAIAAALSCPAGVASDELGEMSICCVNSPTW